MHTWKEDARRYDAPGFDLNDPAGSLAVPYQAGGRGDTQRGRRRGWRRTWQADRPTPAFTEIVLPNMALEVYEGFAQVVVPILQSRVNSTVRIEQRQSVLYGLDGASAGE